MKEQWLDLQKRNELRHELSEDVWDGQGEDATEFVRENWNDKEKYGTIMDRKQGEKIDKKDEWK